MHQLAKLQRHDPLLRASFNALSEATFGLNFEGWYQNGFWTDSYRPISPLWIKTWMYPSTAQGCEYLFEKEVAIEEVIHSFGAGIKHVTLDFTPADKTGWEAREFQQEDCTFFVKGQIFKDFHSAMLRIPTLSHA